MSHPRRLLEGIVLDVDVAEKVSILVKGLGWMTLPVRSSDVTQEIVGRLIRVTTEPVLEG